MVESAKIVPNAATTSIGFTNAITVNITNSPVLYLCIVFVYSDETVTRMYNKFYPQLSVQSHREILHCVQNDVSFNIMQTVNLLACHTERSEVSLRFPQLKLNRRFNQSEGLPRS